MLMIIVLSESSQWKIYFHGMTCLFFSLLSGGADGYIAVHDLLNTSGSVKHKCESVAHVGLSNRYRHKFSVECVLWYPLDTGIFTSSGTDKLLKIWDTNRLKVRILQEQICIFMLCSCFIHAAVLFLGFNCCIICFLVIWGKALCTMICVLWPFSHLYEKYKQEFQVILFYCNGNKLMLYIMDIKFIKVWKNL